MHARRAIIGAAAFVTLASAGAAPSADTRNATSNPPANSQNANQPANTSGNVVTPATQQPPAPVSSKGRQGIRGQAKITQPARAVPVNKTPVTTNAVHTNTGASNPSNSNSNVMTVQPVVNVPAGGQMQCTTNPGASVSNPSVVNSNVPNTNFGAAPVQVPGVDAQVAQGIERWMNANRPSQQHEALSFFVGNWNAKVVYSNLPGSFTAGGTFSGKVVTSWTHGKRFLRSEFTGGVGGEGFTATATFGFNNAAGRFEGTWMDSTSTGVRTSTGNVDANGKVYTFTSTFPDPVRATPTTFKEVFTLDNDNQYTVRVFEVGKNANEHRVQEVVYTRAN